MLFANGLFASEQSRPNVLLILTDDQGFGDISLHGNPVLKTKHLDQLAKQGARFDRFFVSPVCAPTRAAMLTGRYHPRTGVHGVTRAAETMRASEYTLAEVFQDNGYQTAMFGKWHNGAHYPHHPNGQGFDEFKGFCAGHWNNYFDTTIEHNGRPLKTEGFLIDRLTDISIDWIADQTGDSQPWFCYLSLNTPHTPWQVPEAYWQKYQDFDIPPETACAYAMVQNIDDNIGRILAKLKQIDAKDNTIVLFLTDNGANTARFNAGMRGRKGSAHEGGTRVPLFVRYPGVISPGTVVEPITAHIDLLPTLVDLAGLKFEPAHPIDGKSLQPLLTNAVSSWPERTLFTTWRDRGAVRNENYRAVQQRGDQWMLFDMRADPGETEDLASQQPDRLAEMKQQYEQWWNDVAAAGFDPIPAELGHPEAPQLRLPAHEAILLSEAKTNPPAIRYHGKQGWANDYIDHWISTAGYASWPIQVVEPGEYLIYIDFNADPESVGSELKVTLGDQSLEWTVTRGFQSGPVPSPDRIARKEVYEKSWATDLVGRVKLTQTGITKLTLRGLKKVGGQFPQIKRIQIEPVAP